MKAMTLAKLAKILYKKISVSKINGLDNLNIEEAYLIHHFLQKNNKL